MKIQEANRTIQSSGVITKKEFTAKFTGKAYKMFADTLYKDKIGAINRELSCNAIDSHRWAQKLDVPYHMHLPNEFEPYYSLRDFGVGMDHEKVMTVYSTFFDSDKTGSNDDIGGLGLGSKTPLSYCDLYTVTSWFDGMQRVYSCYYNEDGIPEVSLLSETVTEEPNGVEVTFPVLKKDFMEFRMKAERALKYFKYRPTVTGAMINIPQITYLISGKGWGIVDKGVESGAGVLMGGVRYPISDMDISSFTPSQIAVVKSNINIEFAIGDLEVAPSRESLSFDKITLATLIARIDEIVLEITEILKKEIGETSSLLEARFKYLEITYGPLSTLKDILAVTTVEYNGKPVSFEQVNFRELFGDPIDDKNAFAIDLFSLSSYADNGKYVSGKVVNRVEMGVLNLKAIKSHKFMLCDRSSHGVKGIMDSYLRSLRNTGESDTKVVLVRNYNNNPENIEKFNKFIESIGFSTDYKFELISTYTLRSEYRPQREKILQWVGNKRWETVTIDFNDTSTLRLYVDISYNKVLSKFGFCTGSGGMHFWNMKRTLNLLDSTFKIDTPIYGVKKIFNKKLIKNKPNWFHFDEYFFNAVDKNPALIRAAEYAGLDSAVKRHFTNYSLTTIFDNLSGKLYENHPLMKLYKEVIDVVNLTSQLKSGLDIDIIRNTYSKLGLLDTFQAKIDKAIEKAEEETPCLKDFNKLLEGYPLIKSLSGNTSCIYGNWDHVAHYVLGVDLMRAMAPKNNSSIAIDNGVVIG